MKPLFPLGPIQRNCHEEERANHSTGHGVSKDASYHFISLAIQFIASDASLMYSNCQCPFHVRRKGENNARARLLP